MIYFIYKNLRRYNFITNIIGYTILYKTTDKFDKFHRHIDTLYTLFFKKTTLSAIKPANHKSARNN